MATPPKKKAASRQSEQQAAMGRRLTQGGQKGFRGGPPKGTTRNQYSEASTPYDYMPSYDRNTPSVRPHFQMQQDNMSYTPSPTVRGWGGGNGYVVRDWGNNIIGTSSKQPTPLTVDNNDEQIRRALALAGIRYTNPFAPNTAPRQFMR
jgi:hypothetical protein